MREGSSLRDFFDPPFTLIGGKETRALETLEELYKPIKAPCFCTSYRQAEMVKYVCNSFHALKITFANEVGNICKSLGIDGHEVMKIFSTDTKLNISDAYLKPGFAFGGSCLPKDLRALLYKAKTMDVELPLLNSILPSNQRQIQNTMDMILKLKKRKIGIVGLSFKAGTDDLRESPLVILAENLIGKGYELKIFDENVATARLIGSNKEYIEKEIPHISSILTSDINDLIKSSEVIIVGNYYKKFEETVSRIKRDQIVVDLIRAFNEHNKDRIKFEYHGICC
jgi:GDP-mannose 6-dehydrogenase